MKQKYEIAFNSLIKELSDTIKDNEQSISEILPDQRFIEALQYQIENFVIESVIDRIEDTLKDLSESAEPTK